MQYLNPTRRYTSTWWSINVPEDWTVKDDPECTTFTGGRFRSALQISAAKKDSDITLEEIEDLATSDEMSRRQLRRIAQGEFEGFSRQRSHGDVFMREWWLAKGTLLVYITYSVDVSRKDGETTLVDQILASLGAM